MTVGGRVAWTVAVGLLVGLAARPTLAGDRSQTGLEAAIEEAKEALGKAGTDAEAVKARWLLARIYEALGRPLAAVQELDAMRSLPLPTEMARKREERAIALADEVPTVAEIEDLLVATRDVPLRTRPAVAIRIHFDTDQAKLSDRGQLEVSKLVDAMRSGRWPGSQFCSSATPTPPVTRPTTTTCPSPRRGSPSPAGGRRRRQRFDHHGRPRRTRARLSGRDGRHPRAQPPSRGQSPRCRQLGPRAV